MGRIIFLQHVDFEKQIEEAKLVTDDRDLDNYHTNLGDVQNRIIALVRRELIVLPNEIEQMRKCRDHDSWWEFMDEITDAVSKELLKKIGLDS